MTDRKHPVTEDLNTWIGASRSITTHELAKVLMGAPDMRCVVEDDSGDPRHHALEVLCVTAHQHPGGEFVATITTTTDTDESVRTEELLVLDHLYDRCDGAGDV